MLSDLPVEELLKIPESRVSVVAAEDPTSGWTVGGGRKRMETGPTHLLSVLRRSGIGVFLAPAMLAAVLSGCGSAPALAARLSARGEVLPAAVPMESARTFPIRATISLDGEDYRVGEEATIEFRLENVSDENVFMSVFDQDSWAGYCVLLTPEGRKIEGYFPRDTYLPYIELTDHKELITSRLVELNPGGSYVCEYRGLLREARGPVEVVWVYGLYWGWTPEEVTQGNDRVSSNKVSVTIKPTLTEEMFDEARSGVAALGDRYRWWELLEDPDSYKRAAAANLLRREMLRQVADVRYFDFPADRLRVDLERLAAEDGDPLVRVEAAWAWPHWSLGTSYQESERVIPVLVKELTNVNPFVRALASAACTNFVNLANFTEERPVNGQIFHDALLSQIEGENDEAVKTEMLYVLLDFLSLERPGAHMDRARTVDALNWGLQTGDNDLCLRILTHHGEWVASPQSVPFLSDLLHHDGANNSGDIRSLAARALTYIHSPQD
ncbi:MAG: hypothetical protein ABIK85_01120 [Candidatus Eisenbacteria bacterium]